MMLGMYCKIVTEPTNNFIEHPCIACHSFIIDNYVCLAFTPLPIRVNAQNPTPLHCIF
jgi:hypothetical protein